MSEADCPYCDGPMPKAVTTKDHIVPRVLCGQRLGPQNIIRVCRACNQLKGEMTPDALVTLAEEMEFQARQIREMARRVDVLIGERGLLPAALRGD
ncbi:HNH endonuclease [Sphingobium sp. CR2-8]|uniref:HNH endonuclease n=1 Tax=Sphingobium sp. CR2-8 TaxID=1306534 RepID=UPI002DBED7FF|nr:HNH endonuclease [Sphingobium sp. CR2-8]MEC3912355.1 HNH endonuclease [Sphingobium sp. CR2-8]